MIYFDDDDINIIMIMMMTMVVVVIMMNIMSSIYLMIDNCCCRPFHSSLLLDRLKFNFWHLYAHFIKCKWVLDKSIVGNVMQLEKLMALLVCNQMHI